MTDLGFFADAVATAMIVGVAFAWLIRGAREPAGCATCATSDTAAASPTKSSVPIEKLSLGRRRPDTLSQL